MTELLRQIGVVVMWTATNSWTNYPSAYVEGLREIRKLSKRPVSTKELKPEMPENV